MTPVISAPASLKQPPLPKTVRVLGFVSFLNDAAADMIYPLLPVFLTQVLGAGPASLGLIEGVAESSVSLFKLFSGVLSDRFRNRKSWIVAGYGVSNLVRPLMAIASTWPQVLILRFADRIGKGLRTSPRDALVADAVSPDQRGRAYGYHRAMDHAGAVVGPLVAACFLIAWNLPLRTVFLLSAIPGTLCLLLILFGLKRGASSPAEPAPFHPREAWRQLPPTLKHFLSVLFIFTLGNASDAFLILKAKNLGLSTALILVLWSFFHVVKSGTSFLGGRLSDRVGRRSLLVAGWGIYAAVYAGFAYAKTPLQVWMLFGIYGLFFGLTEGVERALVADFAPGVLRGSVFGLYHLISGVASLFASLIFGLLWKWGGDPLSFLVGAGFALLAAAALMFLSPPARVSAV
ncbi:MAG: MFS transporter [Elusimicrobia bacterium]|nr:MFS transporter [Elusimicrobiota bacterium]